MNLQREVFSQLFGIAYRQRRMNGIRITRIAADIVCVLVNRTAVNIPRRGGVLNCNNRVIILIIHKVTIIYQQVIFSAILITERHIAGGGTAFGILFHRFRDIVFTGIIVVPILKYIFRNRKLYCSLFNNAV